MDFPTLAEQEDSAGQPQFAARRAGAAPPPAGAFHRLVRWIDRWLRERQGIFEFTANPDCVLRIAIRPSEIETVLSDGARIRRGDPIIDLHLWNEQVPQMGQRGPDIAWSTVMRQRMRDSFVQLAAWLEAHPERRDVVAVRALTPFVSHGNARAMERISASYRFEPVQRRRRRGALQHLHDLGENLLIWALVRTFNPGGLRAKRLMRRRHDFWISRARFLEQYGASGPTGAARPPKGP